MNRTHVFLSGNVNRIEVENELLKPSFAITNVQIVPAMEKIQK